MLEIEMTHKKFSGVYAAVLTPRGPDDSVDAAALAKLIEFLSSKGITKFALNGATGEFCLATPTQLQVLVATVRAPGSALAVKYADIAGAEGAAGLLLPTPYFFRYHQHDLAAFCTEVAMSAKMPVLLYNLPQFSSGFSKDTVRTLISEVPSIVGIKDSGGTLDILRELTAQGVEACRFVGNDINLRAALSEGVCDGVVSGVACVLPELVLRLYAQGERAASGEFDPDWDQLKHVVARLDAFPTPWALKWMAEARGVVPMAHFSQPVAASVAERAREMQEWFKGWLPTALPRETRAR
jgi:4-hydroxy-tetrahydrodipicolinate synthase